MSMEEKKNKTIGRNFKLVLTQNYICRRSLPCVKNLPVGINSCRYQESNESLIWCSFLESEVRNLVELFHEQVSHAYTFTTSDKSQQIISRVSVQSAHMCVSGRGGFTLVFRCVCTHVQVVSITGGQPGVSLFGSYPPCSMRQSRRVRHGTQ